MEKQPSIEYRPPGILIPPVYFTLSLLLLWLSDRYLPVVPLQLYPYNMVIALPLAVIGGWFVVSSLMLFREHQTARSFIPSTTLVTGGCYRFSRNPMYLGLLLILIGFASGLDVLSTLIAPLFFFLVMNWIFIPNEELKMCRDLGADYLNYRQRVRRWI